MKLRSIEDVLQNNPYPGRGILLGRTADGMRGLAAYFIMGRSATSRNRRFVEEDGGLAIVPADPTGPGGNELTIYRPVYRSGEATIVANGSQSDDILECIDRAHGFEEAMGRHTFEPDPPHHTPRIAGVLRLCFDGFSYQLGIVKGSGGERPGTQRFFYHYPQPKAGEGQLIHTYMGDGDPLPAFAGEPVPVLVEGTIDAFGQRLWDSLDAENRVALFVRTVTLEGGEETRIWNGGRP